MKKSWLGLITIAAVALLLAGCAGGVPNLLDHRVDVALDEGPYDYDAVTGTVTIGGSVNNISLSNTSPIDVDVFVWLIDAQGFTITPSKMQAVGFYGPLTELLAPKDVDARRFEAIIELNPDWNWDPAEGTAGADAVITRRY